MSIVSQSPPLPPIYRSLGITSFVVGLVGALLFFFPVIGIPISFIGVVLGVAGALAVRARHAPGIRMCMAGIAMSLLALGINFLLWYAPLGGEGTGPKPSHESELPSHREVPPNVQPPER